ncbi:lysophospholipid acyltransferase family protein [Mycobacterium sp. CVI_P3]|uniref:Lysophospholipid acyltransferase family protein n=1 Tax=Mycobacterium pinniadriaticum TaxID=2994102 RepID=A0ABT3SKH8_9MYCO|nr:lysophospholipid acyltransferase family protein [Mycobacterium pinniadriaticum]MCX2933494.1 lysophospholipid acyltransferase family protein [Mycobacterium pinniadriaticum]MCX2939867.1 lysophospholipid acyltransferase family protein [Mycobacterium pinniadriaticum]
MEPVFRTLEIAASVAVRAAGTKITFEGLENVPARGGAVVAINHTSYIDFLPAALGTYQRKRRIRFMIKAEMQDVRIVNLLIRRTKTIPVNRRAGGEAYVEAVRQLKAGELVGVYPEATISRAFVLKDFKSGAARMALEAQVPIIPCIVWGAHRIWTKDHPKQLRRNKIPFTVRFGRPLPPTGTAAELEAALKDQMSAILHEVQLAYPHPAGEYWVPEALGGGAPSLQEAKRLDEAELAERARRAREHH